MYKRKQGMIPSYILKELAEEGNEHAINSLEIAKKVNGNLSKNKKIENEVEEIYHHRAIKQPERLIYNCQEIEGTQIKLVRKEGSAATKDKVVERIYEFSGATLKYLNNVLKRNSLDNKGKDLIFKVHYGCKYMNAEWLPETNDMIIGDGDGYTLSGFAWGIDVIAHEITHGITQVITNLPYLGQTGALNEHFSDVIGSAVKQNYLQQTADTADWLIGDKAVGPGWNGIAIRSMRAPGQAFEKDRQKNHMKDYEYLPITEDHGGVHVNSGILNKAFYSVSMDIGTDNAAIIWYNAWQDKNYLHKNSKFKNAFEGIVKSAQTLVKQGEVPSNTEKIIEKAFKDVGIISIVTI